MENNINAGGIYINFSKNIELGNIKLNNNTVYFEPYNPIKYK